MIVGLSAKVIKNLNHNKTLRQLMQIKSFDNNNFIYLWS